MRVKIIGAGSIGNHLAQASRRMGWDVVIVDTDPRALERTKNDIYPTRYGSWDNQIELHTPDTAPNGGFDIIAIGTPPDVRIPLAMKALKEKPKLILLEKPLCDPSAKGLMQMVKTAKRQKVILCMGYDHAVAESIGFVADLLSKKSIGNVLTLDVEFREHWAGIFKAHSWLKGPHETYLGYTKRGGGASGEHSHALHLWQYLAEKAGMGNWKDVSYMYTYKKAGRALYDTIASFAFRTTTGHIGRVVQDVVTLPTRKWIRVQGDEGYIEWYCNGHEKGDLVKWKKRGSDEIEERVFEKKRPDDFYREMLHIQMLLNKKISPENSPLSIQSGIRVMEVLKTAYGKSQGTSRIKKF